MEVTFAKAVTQEEIKAWNERNKNDNAKKSEQSVKWCAENESRIIADHSKFLHDWKKKQYERYCNNWKKHIKEWNESLDKRNEEINEVYRLAEHLENGGSCKCSCTHEGQMVRRTGQTYDFIGCSKFNQPGCEKQTYNFKEELKEKVFEDEVKSFEEFDPYRELTHRYIGDIKKYNNYPKYVKPSDIFRTLKVNQIDFYCDVTEDDFNNGVKSSRQSKHEELAFLERLKTIPNCRVLYQQHFRFKEEGKDGLSRCIPDYIVYNGNKIVILDAKKNIDSCNMNQLDKYTKVVHAACKTPTEVKAYHILFDRSNASLEDLERNQVLTLNDIKNEFK